MTFHWDKLYLPFRISFLPPQHTKPGMYESGFKETTNRMLLLFLTVYTKRKRFTIRNWLTQLWKLTSPKICNQQAGDSKYQSVVPI